MFKSKNALLFGSFALIILGITVVTILERTNQTSGSEDVRARAGAVGTLKMIAIVSSVDEAKGVVTVDNLQFDSDNSKNLGMWTVTPPATTNLAGLYPGARITMIVEPKTFLAATKTLTAKEIKMTR